METRDTKNSPWELSHIIITLIINNDLAWMAVRNDFHSFLRIPCLLAKAEIARFLPSIEKLEKPLNENKLDLTQEQQDIVVRCRGNLSRLCRTDRCCCGNLSFIDGKSI